MASKKPFNFHVANHELDALTPQALRWAIAYAMADYDCDHFAMKGAHLARRIGSLAYWLKKEMACAVGLRVGM